jgi:hypothetical protein
LGFIVGMAVHEDPVVLFADVVAVAADVVVGRVFPVTHGVGVRQLGPAVVAEPVVRANTLAHEQGLRLLQHHAGRDGYLVSHEANIHIVILRSGIPPELAAVHRA